MGRKKIVMPSIISLLTIALILTVVAGNMKFSKAQKELSALKESIRTSVTTIVDEDKKNQVQDEKDNKENTNKESVDNKANTNNASTTTNSSNSSAKTTNTNKNTNTKNTTNNTQNKTNTNTNTNTKNR